MQPAPALDDATLTALAREAALEYYPPAQIAETLGLPEAQVLRVLAHPDIQSRVARLRREMDESGEKFRLTARKLAMEIVTDIAAIASDDEAELSQRLKAAELVVKWSGLVVPEEAQGVQIHIHGVDEIRQLRAAGPWRNDNAVVTDARFEPVTLDVADTPPEA